MRHLAVGQIVFRTQYKIEALAAEHRGKIVARLRRKSITSKNDFTNEERFFGGAKEVADALQMSRAAISKSISGAKPTKGYRFRFA